LCWWEALVTAGPWDPKAAGAPHHGRLRASDADREQVIDALKVAFVQGRLTKDELDMRAGWAFTSRTYAELAAITVDIAAPPLAPRPPALAPRAPVRKPANRKALAWSACGIILPPAVSAAFLTYYCGFVVLFVLAFIGFTVSSKT
jgi:hypothetical protein